MFGKSFGIVLTGWGVVDSITRVRHNNNTTTQHANERGNEMTYTVEAAAGVLHITTEERSVPDRVNPNFTDLKFGLCVKAPWQNSSVFEWYHTLADRDYAEASAVESFRRHPA